MKQNGFSCGRDTNHDGNKLGKLGNKSPPSIQFWHIHSLTYTQYGGESSNDWVLNNRLGCLLGINVFVLRQWVGGGSNKKWLNKYWAEWNDDDQTDTGDELRTKFILPMQIGPFPGCSGNLVASSLPNSSNCHRSFTAVVAVPLVINIKWAVINHTQRVNWYANELLAATFYGIKKCPNSAAELVCWDEESRWSLLAQIMIAMHNVWVGIAN